MSDQFVSTHLHHAVSFLLLLATATLLVLGLVYAVASIIGWKTSNRNRRLIRAGICLLLTPCMPGLYYLYTMGVTMPAMGRMQQAQMEASLQTRLEETTHALPGDQAPEFTVTDADGQPFKLSDHRGQVVLINFFATWCGPCLQELPHLQALWERHAEEAGFTMLVIGREETAETVEKFRIAQGYTFPIAADPDRAVFDQFATEGIPRTILIARDGSIASTTLGFRESDLVTIEKEIDQQLQATDQVSLTHTSSDL